MPQLCAQLALSILLMHSADTPAPPVARKVPRVSTLHGETLTDDYHWLRDKASPEVIAYLEAENAYTAAIMAPTTAFQESLYAEMLSHIQETDLSVPYRQRGWLHYSRTEQGKQYPIRCRRRDAPQSPEEVTLDLNELARGEKFLGLGTYEVNEDGTLLAYSTDTTGFRQYTLAIKDLRTGSVLPERMPRVTDVAWAADGKTLFYVTEDAAKRPYRLHRHVAGEPAERDVLVFEETDELFHIDLKRARSGAYLVLQSSSHTTSECRILEAARPRGDWRIVAPRVHEHEYEVDHHGDLLYIRTNDRGRNFRLVAAPMSDPRREAWGEVVPHRADVLLERIELFARHLVLVERRGGLPRLSVRDLGSGAAHDVSFPEPAYAVAPQDNREWETAVLRYNYQSLVTPPSIYDYDLDRREAKLLKRTPVPGGFEPERYVSERIAATATDGVPVPISIVFRKDVKRDGTAPLLLTGYGAYGLAFPVTFSPARLALLDRGVVFAIAHIRGGSEMGKPWHDDGRMLRKRNTFTDFIAAAEHLIVEKRTSRDRLAITGGSAGGLLMGAVTNLRPDLFRAVVSQVPFLDVINSMSDATLPLTAGEWEEWGDPVRNVEHYRTMRSYSPYENLERKAYPAIAVVTSLNDSQVMYWEPAKYVARLRTLKTDSNPLLLKTNMAAGHGGASGRYDRLREVAWEYAFILWQLGIRA